MSADISTDLTATPPLAGYFDRISVRPGERIALKASAERAGPVQVETVRIGYADKNPSGPGMVLTPYAGIPTQSFAGRTQKVALGSWGHAPAAGLFDTAHVTLHLRYQPWLVRDAGAAVLAYGTPDQAIWALVSTPAGLAFEVDGAAIATIPVAPRRKKWYDISVDFDLRQGRVTLSAVSLDRQQSGTVTAQATFTPDQAARIYFAAEPSADGMRRHVNGRIEDVTFRTESAAGPVRAFWDFSLAMQGLTIIDSGPLGLHGQLVNLPTRAVQGSLWDGSAQSFLHAPRHYAAIHFHEDDIYDCKWDTDLEIEIPADMPSGIYGLKLTQGPAEDIVPFFVLAPKGQAKRSKICYLASTFTYQAYGNHARKNLDQTMRDRMADWQTPKGPDSHGGFGYSTYNFHPDGSGTCYSSRLRPLLTMRPGFLTFAIHEGSGLRHFPADGHLTEWFDRKSLPFDVVTDEDLHREGVSVIEGYDVVITGSHPEYHTTQSLNALCDYSAAGGNFIYLGGNGFYWRIAASDVVPGVIEVRRAEGGIRAWATEPGEGYQVLDGQYGGLWRRNGRPPQAVGAVGFSAQGLFEGSHYRRTEASYAPDNAWIFDGVNEEHLGDYGYSGGGAAGFELDRADFSLGTPENTVVLARSEGHGPSFMVVPEEVLSHIATVSGEPPKDLVRAEIVHARLPSGGQIFTSGSITFCGSLPWNNFDNGVSRMLENVVRRFAGLDA